VAVMSKQPLFDQLDQFITEMLTNPDVMVRSADVDDALLEELLGIARDLPDLPAPGFKVSLKASLQAELERNASMSTKAIEFRPGF